MRKGPATSQRKARNVTVVDNRPLARRIGSRIRAARQRAGMTQHEVAAGRYTAAYISALELGHSKPSMAALTFVAERLGVPVREFLAEEEIGPSRLEADLLLASGDAQGALDRYEELLERRTDARSRAGLLRGQAEALCRLGRGEEAIQPATRARDLFREGGRATDAADAAYWLAYAQYQVDNTAEARSLLADLLEQVRAGLELVPDFQFRILMAIANVEMRESEYQRAIAYMEEARALAGDLDLRRRATLLSGLALSYREAGDLEASVTSGLQSLALYRAVEAQRDEAALANNLALTYLEVGNLARAEELLASAAHTAERLDDRRLLAHVLESQARVALARDDLDGADALVARSLDAARATANHQAEASAHQTAAKVARLRGSATGAIDELEAAVALLRRDGPRARLQETLGDLAVSYRDQGDLAKATDLYEEALRIRR